MKKILLFLIFCSLSTFNFQLSTAATQEPGARFAFERTEYDFGDVPHNTKKIEYRFEFTNAGSEPLVITRALTSCSCVKVSYDKQPVPPGEKGTITVAYEVSKKEPGVFYKLIEVYSNSVDRRISLIVKGNAVE
jgi:hypothetical protein